MSEPHVENDIYRWFLKKPKTYICYCLSKTIFFTCCRLGLLFLKDLPTTRTIKTSARVCLMSCMAWKKRTKMGLFTCIGTSNLHSKSFFWWRGGGGSLYIGLDFFTVSCSILKYCICIFLEVLSTHDFITGIMFLYE